MKSFRRIHLVGLGLFLLPVVGLFIALVLLQTNQDLRGSAWGGILWNTGIFGQNPVVEQPRPPDVSESKSAVLFHELTKTYWNAEVVNVDLPEFQVQGVAFEAYDADLDKSFIFARIENFPYRADKPLRVWMEDAAGNYLKGGLAEFVMESDVIVMYLVTSLEGDIESYQTVHFSYDDTVGQLSPTASVLSLAIHDGEQPE